MGQRRNIYEIVTYRRRMESGQWVEDKVTVRVPALSRGHLYEICKAKRIPVRNSKTDVKFAGAAGY